ncbi:TPA: hypothetical protein L3N15_004199 [Vibrio parahaemolyticus]|nr:hypothetical protein [Vibrio parahaemolyticus]
MALSFREKIELKKEAREKRKIEIDKSTSFPERLKAKRRRREIMAMLKGEAKPEKSIIDKYKAGEFNSLPVGDFKAIMQQVNDEGLSVSEVGEGMLAYFTHNGIDVDNEEMMLEGISAAELEQKAHEAATSPLNNLPEPTEAQKLAGVYKKGRFTIHGLDITVENPIGSYRTGKDSDGNEWATKMKHHYGDIKRTHGADGDPVDVFLGPDAHDADMVYVVDQVNPDTQEFDEHKVMIGFPSLKEAKRAYLANYDRGWKGLKSIHAISMSDFKEWLKNGNTKVPFANYVSGNTAVIFHQSLKHKLAQNS